MLYSMYISDAALTNYAANKRNETNRVKSKCGQKANAMEIKIRNCYGVSCTCDTLQLSSLVNL